MRLTRVLPGLLFLVSILSSCAEPLPVENRVAKTRGLQSAVVEYGVPVPVDARLDRGPEPYDPVKHGPLGSPDPSMNLARRSEWRPPVGRGPIDMLPSQRGGSIRHLPAISPSHGSWTDGNRGLWITQPSRGVFVYHEAQLDVKLPAGPDWERLIYAPTDLAHGGSCLEATTIHRTSPSVTKHAQGFWNFCEGSGGWVWLVDMDTPLFKQRYLRSMANPRGQYELAMVLQVMADAVAAPDASWDCWRGLIFNFEMSQYEQVARSCGVSSLASGFGGTGWTMWESMHLMDLCRTIPSISAYYHRVRDLSGQWVAVDPSQVSDLISPSNEGACWYSGTYRFASSIQQSSPYLYWFAETPNS